MPSVILSRQYEHGDRIILIPISYVLKKERSRLIQYLVQHAQVCEVIDCEQGIENHSLYGEPKFSNLIHYKDEDGIEHTYDDYNSEFIPYDYDALLALLKLYHKEIKNKIKSLQELDEAYDKNINELYDKYFGKFYEENKEKKKEIENEWEKLLKEFEDF